jgi:hypothetical protein
MMRKGLVTSSQFNAIVDESSAPGIPRSDSGPSAEVAESSFATRVVGHIHALLHGAPLFQPGDPQHAAHVARFAGTLRRELSTTGVGRVRLNAFPDRLELNDRVYRAPMHMAERERWLFERLGRLGIAELVFEGAVTDENVAALLSVLMSADRYGSVVPDTRWETVAVRATVADQSVDALVHSLSHCRRFAVLALYADALAATRRWGYAIQEGGRAPLRDATHFAARLIDAYDRDPAGLLGMLALRPIAGTFGSRRLDAAIVAIALLRELEFSEQLTLDLVTTALIRRVPDGWGAWWVRAPGEPIAAARLAMEAETPLAQVISFEGAAPVGLSIPDAYYGRAVQPHAGTLVMNVACAYVDLLQPGQASNPFSPEAALQMMIAQSDKYFEGTVLAALGRALGAWPPGAIVRLNSGDFAVVIERAGPDAATSRPVIRPVDGSSTAVYDLSRPELAPYRVVSAATADDCPANPMYAFIL